MVSLSVAMVSRSILPSPATLVVCHNLYEEWDDHPIHRPASGSREQRVMLVWVMCGDVCVHTTKGFLKSRCKLCCAMGKKGCIEGARILNTGQPVGTSHLHWC